MDITWEMVLGPVSPSLFLSVAIKIMAAAFLGGCIGWDREQANRPAGLRTHMLLCMGTMLILLIPSISGMPADAISRFGQGIGAFLGGLAIGSVFKPKDGEVSGLTTAMTSVPTAGIGIAIAMGYTWVAILATIATLIILRVFIIAGGQAKD